MRSDYRSNLFACYRRDARNPTERITTSISTFQNLHFLHLMLIFNDLSLLFLHQILHQILHQTGMSSTLCACPRICPSAWDKESGGFGHTVLRRKITCCGWAYKKNDVAIALRNSGDCDAEQLGS